MIRIYYVDLSGGCSIEQSLAMYGHLPEERRIRIDNMKNETLKHKRIQTAYFLYNVLSKETGIPMEDIRFTYNPQGKPELDYPACRTSYINMVNSSYKENPIIIEETQSLHFNLSHSGRYAVLAVSRYPVGVDVEHKSRGYESVAKRCFTGEEYEDIMGKMTEEEQRLRFLEIWTMKEAYVKYVGAGMKISFASFDTRKLPGNRYTIYLPAEEGDAPYILSVYGQEEMETTLIPFAEFPIG